MIKRAGVVRNQSFPKESTQVEQKRLTISGANDLAVNAWEPFIFLSPIIGRKPAKKIPQGRCRPFRVLSLLAHRKIQFKIM